MTMAAYNAAKALVNDGKFSSKTVRVMDSKLFLHGTCIAEKGSKFCLTLYPRKYPSLTTNRYLNGLIQYARPDMQTIHLRNKQPFFSGQPAPDSFLVDFWEKWIAAAELVTPEGYPIQRGETIGDRTGAPWVIQRIQKPHKPGSTGRIHVTHAGTNCTREFFPSVLNLHWKALKEI